MNLSILQSFLTACPGSAEHIRNFFLQIVLVSTIVISHLNASAQRACANAEPVVSEGVVTGASVTAPLPEIVIIPVVVHIVYERQEQNISNDQVKSQIAVLNKDFRMKNTDASFIPAAFRHLAADSRIEFRLATLDPSGVQTNGITRTHTNVTAFAADDRIKSAKTGGVDSWNRDEYLNIWVGNLNAGVMGYASTPGCAAEKDGVVIRYSVFGTTANVAAPFNKGRTAVHEIGHWLGLRHIWGDAACGDDRIDDTPPQQGPTRGCPSGVVSSCTSGAAGNMYMNFMDFTNDECTNMFTHGQAERMRALFAPDGHRAALLTSKKAVGAEEEYWVDQSPVQKNIYPNPAAAFVNIPLNSDMAAGTILRIHNHSGQVVKTARATSSALRIDVRHLTAGMYYVSMGNGKVMKFIKN